MPAVPKAEFSLQDAPNSPGVYVFRNSSGDVIYVGKAKALRRRLANYFQPSRARTADIKLRSLIHSIQSVEILPVHSEAEALLLESRLVKQFNPRYNVELRDDKRFLVVAIDLNDPFPRLVLSRLKKDDGRAYFGPFPRARVLRQTVRFLSTYFGLRTCAAARPDEAAFRHCLDSVVRLCCCPCQGKVSPEDYRVRVEGLLAALRGDVGEIVARLDADMKRLAGAHKFEEAARVRDTIENIRYVCDVERRRSFERVVRAPVRTPQDAVAALQQALGLARAPETIECFDISNIGGILAVASLVCFRQGRPSPKDYRRFRIRTVSGADDFAMMGEAVGRRYARLLAEGRPLPDLVVIDGGAGQLGAAVRALLGAGAPPLPVLGLAKKREEVYLPGREAPLTLDRHHPGLHLLQAVRDEAHRFALLYHLTLRRRRTAESILDDVEGVGQTRKEQLLRAFGSVAGLRQATPEAMCQRVPGLGRDVAQRIADTLGRPRLIPADHKL